MSRLVAQIASFCVLRTVSRNVSLSLTVVASVVGTIVSTFRTTPRNVPRFSAIIAWRHIRALVTIFGKMAFPIAPVTPGLLLFTVSGVVTHFVALVALIASPTVVSATARVAASTTTPRGRTFAGEMPRLIAFIADAGWWHFDQTCGFPSQLVALIDRFSWFLALNSPIIPFSALSSGQIGPYTDTENCWKSSYGAVPHSLWISWKKTQKTGKCGTPLTGTGTFLQHVKCQSP